MQLGSGRVDAAREFATPVGEVMWAWNYCHSSFANLFCTIVAPHNLTVGHALWHSLQSDHTQRAQLISAARVVLSKKKPMLRRIEWAKRSADSLSTIRNDAALVSTAFSTHLPVRTVVPNIAGTAPNREPAELRRGCPSRSSSADPGIAASTRDRCPAWGRARIWGYRGQLAEAL